MKLLAVIILGFFLFSGCSDKSNEHNRDELVKKASDENPRWRDQDEIKDAEVNKAIAVLQPAEGKNVSGIVTFTREDNGIKIVADIKGLKQGRHGFHIHEFGDCSAADFSSAGGHFNPMQTKHGAPTDKERHPGDFGNIEADASGNVHFEWTDSVITFSGVHSILGHAVVVHEKEDDLSSQPSGDAGGRVACGVIGIAKE